MKLHRIKVADTYADKILCKAKTFEIRLNDRDYQVGDLIVFNVVDSNGNYKLHTIQECVWLITYVLNEFEGLCEGYVIFSMRKLTSLETLQKVRTDLLFSN